LSGPLNCAVTIATTVTLSNNGRGFQVEARIDSRSIDFIVDTGASAIALRETSALDDVIPTLAGREEPLLLDVVIAPTTTFAP